MEFRCVRFVISTSANQIKQTNKQKAIRDTFSIHLIIFLKKKDFLFFLLTIIIRTLPYYT